MKYSFGGLDFKSGGRGGGGGLTIWARLNSQRGRGAKFSEGARFLRATMFCGSIVINYSYHYVYSNIYDIAESLTQQSWPYLAI